MENPVKQAPSVHGRHPARALVNSLIRDVAQKRKSGALTSPEMLITCVTWSEQLYLLSLSHYIFFFFFLKKETL